MIDGRLFYLSLVERFQFYSKVSDPAIIQITGKMFPSSHSSHFFFLVYVLLLSCVQNTIILTTPSFALGSFAWLD